MRLSTVSALALLATCLLVTPSCSLAVEEESSPQNFAIDVEIKPPKPYTGEHITFTVQVWNTTKKGYKGAMVSWEIFEDGSKTHTANGTERTNKKGRAFVDYAKRKPGTLLFAYKIKLPEGAELGGDEEVTVVDPPPEPPTSASTTTLPLAQELEDKVDDVQEAAKDAMKQLRVAFSKAVTAILQ